MIQLTDLLRENSYKSVVLNLSRYLVSEFKKNLGKKNRILSHEHLPGKDAMGEEMIEFDLIVDFIPKKQKDAFNIEAAASLDEVHIIIEYLPDAFPAAYNDFIPLLKESLRHEIEHVLQGQRDSIKKWDIRTSETPFYKYLLFKQEIPAYIRGLNTRAKTKKITLGQAFEEYFKEMENSFNSKKEIDIVRKVWTDWAKKNLPKTKL